MTVWIEQVRRTLPDGSAVRDAVAAFSPFGLEQTIAVHNGARVEADSDAPLCEGDTLAFFPLLIGG